MSPSTELCLFISYSHTDRDYLNALMPTLRKCKRQFGISYLTDQEIPRGEDWNNWITNTINSADIIMPLVSTEYLDSEYVINTELPLMQRRCDEGTPLIPIYVRYSRPEMDSILYTRQGLNTPSKPISDMSLPERDRYFAAFEKDIETIAQEIRRKKSWPGSSEKTNGHEQDTLKAMHVLKDMAALTTRYNIVVVGRTGVGKSALINYLFDAEICASKTGKPVTKRGFHREYADIGGVQCTIFDSWGLETSTADIWLQDLEEELSLRSVAKPPPEWFHTIIYCIQASGHRIEPFDSEILKRFWRDRYRVVVTFTKADSVSRKTLADLESALREEVGDDIACIPVCSVSEETITGKTLRFGLADLIAEIRLGFWQSIMDRVPARCAFLVRKYIEVESKKIVSFVTEEAGYFNQNAIAAKVKDSFTRMVSNLTKHGGVIESVAQQEIQDSLNMFKKFAELTDHSLLLQTVESQGHISVPDLATLPQGNITRSILAAAGSFVAGYAALGLGTSILSTLVTVVAGPVGIIGSVFVLGTMRERFIDSMVEAIKRESEDLKNKVSEIEPELRRAILSTQVG